MAGYTLKFSGLEELQGALRDKAKLQAVKTVVAKNGSRLQNEAQMYAPVDTGTLMRSIGLSLGNDSLEATVAPTAHYAAYVELGTRFMEAQPYMKPAFNAVKRQFKADLKRLVK